MKSGRYTIRVWLLFLSIFYFGFAFAQANLIKDEKASILVCEEFMKKLSERKFVEAIQMLKEYSVIDSGKIDTLTFIVSEQMESLGNAYGSIVSYEFIKQRSIENFLFKRIYMLRFEKFYLRFDFTFYNNGKGWRIINFNFTEHLEDVFN